MLNFVKTTSKDGESNPLVDSRNFSRPFYNESHIHKGHVFIEELTCPPPYVTRVEYMTLPKDIEKCLGLPVAWNRRRRERRQFEFRNLSLTFELDGVRVKSETRNESQISSSRLTADEVACWRLCLVVHQPGTPNPLSCRCQSPVSPEQMARTCYTTDDMERRIP
jgi:hypothetical protein